MIVYKYRGCSRQTWELLLNRKLYFAQPSQLNDPLDSTVDISAEYQRARESIVNSDTDGSMLFLMSFLGEYYFFENKESGQNLSLHEAIPQFISPLGILAFSKTSTDALLWAHYADGHRGLCLGFDANELSNEPSWKDVFIKDEISYWDTPPYVDVFQSLAEKLRMYLAPSGEIAWPENARETFKEIYIEALIRSSLLAKSNNWEYEQEYRMISAASGELSFPPTALREVIRGAKIAASDEETLNNILCHPDYAHVQKRAVRNFPGSFEFGLVN
ncbi:MAG: DUF2971 domain-containing protein [Hyphomicrobiaceae bacterium]|nr:DUF2971 domain-containing protein [Nitrospirales bacterium]